MRGEKRATGNHIEDCCHADGEVVVEYDPAPTFVVCEPDILLQVLVVAFDAPARLGCPQIGRAHV